MKRLIGGRIRSTAKGSGSGQGAADSRVPPVDLEADLNKHIPMQLRFPRTPELRYERMAIAFFVSALCFLGGLQFSLWALGAFAPPFSSAFWRAASFGTVAASFLLFSAAFLCFALIKLPSRDPTASEKWKLPVWRLGIGLGAAALACGVAWWLIQVVLVF